MFQGTFMTILLTRWLVITAAILLSSSLLSGIHVASVPTAFLAAAILGILNTFLRPVLLLLTLPLTVLTLGIFAFVLNALMLLLVAYFVPGLEIDGFFLGVSRRPDDQHRQLAGQPFHLSATHRPSRETRRDRSGAGG